MQSHVACAALGQRMPKAHPLAQRRALYETANQLRVTAHGREKRPQTSKDRDQPPHTPGK